MLRDNLNEIEKKIHWKKIGAKNQLWNLIFGGQKNVTPSEIAPKSVWKCEKRRINIVQWPIVLTFAVVIIA